MRIGLNLLHAQPEIGGGWNYIARLVSALSEYGAHHTYVCFVTSQSSSLIPDGSKFERVFVNINPKSRFQRILYENTILQATVKKYRLDLMHWFSQTQSFVNAVPSVVTFYDLHAFDKPLSYSKIKRCYLQTMMSYAARHAALLLPMSSSTALSLHSILKVDEERMSVIPAIVSPEFLQNNECEIKEFRAKYKLPDSFWLYVAHFYQHKNHLRLLEAYHELKLKGFNPWPLVLRGDDHGSLNDVMEAVKHMSLEKDVIFLARLDEGQMPCLYSAAGALVFPSLYEGGGMPVIEALACGCPVIASDIPTTREFGGKSVSLFNPLEIESIAIAMRVFQEDTHTRLQARQSGLNSARDYYPESVIKKLVGAYNSVKIR
jgi:glycosyltransferase involved in cell wall biosynthesis